MDIKNINDLLFSKVDSIVADGGADVFGLPVSAPCTKVSSADDMQGALNTVLSEKQTHSHVLIVTEHEGFKDIILAINKTVHKGKLSVICKGTLLADEAISEIMREESLLHSEDGREFFPKKLLDGTDKLYEDENGGLLLQGGSGGELLYSGDGTCWGCALDGRYTSAGCKGRLTEHLAEHDIRAKADIALKLLDMYDKGMLPEADRIMLFDSAGNTELLCTDGPAQWSERTLAELLSFVYLGYEISSGDKLEMLINARMSMPELPSFLFEELTETFARSIFPSVSCSLPTSPQLHNTAERILMTTAV